MRLFLWISVFSIILVLSVTFVMFYRLIVRPIRKYSKEIDESKRIEPVKSIAELCRLVNAHNKQWDRRTELESFLRAAAETDPLTGLQNRSCMERDFMENEAYRGPLAVLLMDVNYLKTINDSRGHHAGDQLLLATSACIRECFSSAAAAQRVSKRHRLSSRKNSFFMEITSFIMRGIHRGTAKRPLPIDQPAENCYRIGGDEFLVFLKERSEAEVQKMIDHFHAVLARENVSVSVGCAYEEQADGSRFRPMMEIADRRMYAQKRQIHEKDKAEAGAGAP